MGPFSRIKDLALRRRHIAGQFVKFSVVGVINTVLDFSVYVALTRGSVFWGRHILLAATVSFLCAVLSSFILNNYWTFGRRKLVLRQSAKFLAVAAGGLWWNNGILYALTLVGVHDIAAKIAATCAVLAWNFTLQKLWTFRA